MNILRAKVSGRDGSWTLRLMDLDIVAEGASESAMLKEIEYLLTAEYDLAHHYGLTPFVRLLKPEAANAPELLADAVQFRKLNLPQQVCEALAIALRMAKMRAFGIQPEECVVERRVA